VVILYARRGVCVFADSECTCVVTLPLIREQSIVMSMSVCVSLCGCVCVCVFVCPR